MQAMDARKIIDVLGGQTQLANMLNEYGLKVHSRARIHNWYKTNKIPDWAILAYPNVWAKARRMLRGNL